MIFALRVVRPHLAIVLALLAGSLEAQERLFATDSVGSTAGDDSFGHIVDVALSPEGALAVAQFGLSEVWVFDAGGRKQIVGRPGEGPGEFGLVSAVAWRSDTLVVLEGGQRVSLMAGDGRYLGGHNTTRIPAAVRYGPVGYLRSGLTVAAPRVLSTSTAAAKPLHLVDTNGQVAASVGEVRHRRVTVQTTLAGRPISFQHPMPNFTRTALSPDGRYFATADEHESRNGSELQFTLYDDSGREVGRTAVTLETDPASDDDVLHRLDELITVLAQSHPIASIRRAILEEVHRPDRLPAISSFLLDNAGNLWVGSIGKYSRILWRAWSIEGDLVRTWIVEPTLDVRQIHDGRVVAIRHDDMKGWRVIFLRPQAAE